MEMNEWISVEDRLPCQDKWVLLSNGNKIWLGQLDNHYNKDFYCKCCLENFHGVSHWMPLPELPK